MTLRTRLMRNVRIGSFAAALVLGGIAHFGQADAHCTEPPQAEPVRVLMLAAGEAHDYDTLPGKLADVLGVSGDIRVRVTNDLADFTPANLAAADVMLFNCCIKEPPEPPIREAILDALAARKGLVAMHCAVWCFQGWDEWPTIVGGEFESHDPYGSLTSVVVDPSNPILHGVPTRFTFDDEPYVMVAHSPDARPLVRSAEPHGGHAGPEPMVWTQRYRGSRVYTILYGHDEASQFNPVFGKLLRNGIRWAAGRLAPATLPTDIERAEGFIPLFDGQTMDGWRYDPQRWSVRDGVIIGNTHPQGLTQNMYAIHEQAFGDFVLRYKVKLVSGNSGVQFRSHVTDAEKFDMGGYQADVVMGGWGNLHEQYGRRRLVDGWTGKAEHNIDPAGFNDMEVIARGPHVVIKVNGVTTADYTETDPDIPRTGLIGLQIHVGEPMEVHFTNIRIKPLDDG